MFSDAIEMSAVIVRFRMSERRFLGPGGLKSLEPVSSQQAVGVVALDQGLQDSRGPTH